MLIEYIFIILLAFQTLHMLLQDWVDLFPLNDIRQMNQTLPVQTKILVTLGNVLPSVIALGLAIIYLGQCKPLGVAIYYMLYFCLLFVLMYLSWYRPYLFGATPEEIRQYKQEYGHTHHSLPARGANPRPNTLHLVLHLAFLVNTMLAVLISFNLIEN